MLAIRAQLGKRPRKSSDGHARCRGCHFHVRDRSKAASQTLRSHRLGGHTRHFAWLGAISRHGRGRPCISPYGGKIIGLRSPHLAFAGYATSNAFCIPTPVAWFNCPRFARCRRRPARKPLKYRGELDAPVEPAPEWPVLTPLEACPRQTKTAPVGSGGGIQSTSPVSQPGVVSENSARTILQMRCAVKRFFPPRISSPSGHKDVPWRPPAKRRGRGSRRTR